MEQKKSNKKIIIGVAAVVVIIALLAVLYAVFSPKATEGAKSVSIEVIDNNSASTMYDVDTDAEYLSQIFDEVEGLTVEGTEGEYGLYIDTVNGLTADYTVDGAYWSIMVNGEYGNYSADLQPVADGDAYQLVYSVYTAE